MSYWVQKPKIIELMNCKKKKKKCFTISKIKNVFLKIWTIYIFYLIIFLQEFFKELTKYKNDYISIIFKL